MVPRDEVSDRRRMLAKWLLSPQLDEDEALSVVANHPAMIAATQQSPISGEGETWADECRARRVILTLRNKARQYDAGDKPEMAEGKREEADAVERFLKIALSLPPVPSISGGEDQGSNRKGDLPTEQAAPPVVGDQIDAWGRALYEANHFYGYDDEIGWDGMAPNDGGIRDLHRDMALAAKSVWDDSAVSTAEQVGIAAGDEPKSVSGEGGR